MKKEFLLVYLTALVGGVTAHGGKEGPHHQETTSLLGPTDPTALAFTLGISLLGLVMLAFSIRKYRRESS